MPLSGAERAKLYRQRKKENEQEYARYLRKERDRYHKKKERGEIKLISDMSDREKRTKRKEWRLRKQKERTKNNAITHELNIETPPATPTGPFPIRMVSSSRRRMQRNRAKAYRELDKLKQKVADQKRVIEKYKKRLYRQSKKNKNADSPRTKTSNLLKGQSVSANTKRTLLFHHVFLQGIKDKFRKTKSEKSKQLMTKAICSGLLKKYRMQQMAKTQLSLTQRRLNHAKTGKVEYVRKSRQSSLIKKMKEEIEMFLCREDNSRVKAGKKSTKTKSKVKKQVHLLNDTMKHLHMKYLAEDKTRKMSYSLFCNLKPFYIRQPKSSDRETCLCKRHENLQFKVNKLKQLNLLQSQDLDNLTESITCEVSNIKCMYRTCTECVGKKVPIGTFDPGVMVEWYEWKTKKVERNIISQETKSSEIKTSNVTAKEKVKGTLQQLTDEFQDEISRCCKHLFNIKHQFRSITGLKHKMSEHDVLLHIDFSENFGCKYTSEIQSTHFGASQRQVSLHTGVIYTSKCTIPFCSMSDNLKHNPCGIWGHLKPVLKFVQEENPSLLNLFVLSDGPTTQYRCKDNFYLLSKIPLEMGFKYVDWSFMEAGHGKGAPDGIGAVVKREADRAVLHGSDITDAETLLKCLTDLSVKFFIIKDEDMSLPEKDLRERVIRTVPGTMKIHQIFTSKTGEIHHRVVSCFCKAPLRCDCFSPEKVQLIDHTVDTSSLLNTDSSSQTSFGTREKPEIDESLKGQHCVVLYDKKPYPGVIVDIDEGELEVQVMHSIGRNRFFWPMMDDVLWYQKEHFLTIIDPPEKVTNRHYQINKLVWADLEKFLDA